MFTDEIAEDRGVQFYTIGRNPGRGASTGGGGSTISPKGAWWLPTIEMQGGSGVGRPREWRGVGANHRPAVGAEGNATEVCSAQSLATGLGGGDSVFVFSSHEAFLDVSHSTQSTYSTLLYQFR